MSTVICTICKQREAFFFRPYSGESLCRRCFIKSIEEKVRATTAKYKMLEYDDSIAVAVSGGKDSLSLLHILAKTEQKYPKASLVAVSVDEGIRGYRDKAIKMAAENCEIPEKETALYAYIRKIRFQSMPCPYASEAMRNDIRIFLNRMEQKHAGIKFTIFGSIEKIRPRGSHPLHNHYNGECKKSTYAYGPISSDGGLISNVLDLVRYINMYLNRGKYDGSTLLSPGARARDRPLTPKLAPLSVMLLFLRMLL